MLEQNREICFLVRFCVLASGSSGNSAFLATSKTRILIDAGLSVKELARRLAEIGEKPEDLDAVLITHEHSDHVGSGAAGPLRAKKGKPIPVFVSRLTAPLIDWDDMDPLRRWNTFRRARAGWWAISWCRASRFRTTPIDPVGFCLHAEGVKIGIATDLGYMPDSIKVSSAAGADPAARIESRSGNAEGGAVSVERQAARDGPQRPSFEFAHAAITLRTIWTAACRR